MKAFIILAIAAIGYAAPTADPQLLQSGLPAGPLTPAWGGLVATPRGARPIALEGFSEDLNQDGFVDPIGQAVAVAAPFYAHPWAPIAPVAPVAPVIKPAPVEVKAVPAPVLKAAPIISYAAPFLQHHLVHQPITHTYTVQLPPRTETVQVGTHVATYQLPHVLGAHPFLGGFLPAAVKPAEEEGSGAVAVE